jgi:flagellin
MRINHNIAALNTYNKLNSASEAQGKSMEKLSSGLRINRAGDDAAGLAISEKMRGQIRGLDQASRNAQDGISMIQTAEGALNETHDILQRMRELAVQAGSDTNATTDRGEIQKELNQLTSEINRIGNTTEFNTQKLLNDDKSAVKGQVKAVVTEQFGAASAASGITTFTLDGTAVTVNIAPSTASGVVASTIASGINGDATLSAKYAATVSGDTVILTQKVGSATGPSPLTFSGTAGLSGTATSGTSVTGVSGTDASATLQIGANTSQTFSVDISDMRAKALGISSASASTGFTTTQTITDGTNNTKSEFALDVSTATSASAAITTIQTAIDSVSSERSKLGAFQNRLDHTINNLNTSSENLTASESRVRDVDMAKEMMAQTKNSILAQAAQAMLAQANQQPQGVLQLLR